MRKAKYNLRKVNSSNNVRRKETQRIPFVRQKKYCYFKGGSFSGVIRFMKEGVKTQVKFKPKESTLSVSERMVRKDDQRIKKNRNRMSRNV